MEEAPAGGYQWLSTHGAPIVGAAGDVVKSAGQAAPPILCYHRERQPSWKTYQLPENGTYRAEIIDTWEMVVTPVEGTFSGRSRVELPGKPYVAVRFTPVASER